jgi:ABC-type transport system involved in multi-copper enzyme maturation permease subunit
MIATLRAEWIKFRSVRGWLIGLLLVPLLTVGLGYLTASGNSCSNGPYPGQPVALACTEPIGPGGEAVQDQFYFVHQELTGNGTITARLTGLSSTNLQPWAKTGIIIKASMTPGSAYAAMLGTGGNGVRFQYNYTGDSGGLSGLSAHWLRLTRSGDVITGYDSADGTHWSTVGSVTLHGLPATVQAGLFAASPEPVSTGAVQAGQQNTVTGTFTDVTGFGAGTWAGTYVGGVGPLDARGSDYQRAGGTFQVTGHGDIAPAEPGDAGDTIPLSQTLDGAFAGLIAAIVIGTLFITSEYRRGLIWLTLAASPARGRVLAAKALVTGAVTFVAALAGIAVTIPLAEHLLRKNGNFIAPVSMATELRVALGTAAVFALCSVLALAIGTIVRSGATAVMTVIVAVVLPYMLAVSTPLLPATVANWLMRVTPAAGFAIQQTLHQYPQVANTYLPFFGFFPLAPWAGFAVLCAWTLAALLLARHLLNRRDA